MDRHECVKVNDALSSWEQVNQQWCSPRIQSWGLCCLLSILMSFRHQSPVNYLCLQMVLNFIIQYVLLQTFYSWRRMLMYYLNGQNTGSCNVAKCKVVHISNAPYVGNYCLIGINRKYWRPWYLKLKFHAHTNTLLNVFWVFLSVKILMLLLDLFQKHIRCKKGEAKLLSDLKMCYHCEAKKKSYTSQAAYIELQHTFK